MQRLESTGPIPSSSKPVLQSYDSGQECSLSHWLEVCKLVDESEPAKAEEPLELTVSEV
jgi:hypothetical protein